MDRTVSPVEKFLRSPLLLLGAGTILVAPLVAILVLLFPYYRSILSDPFWFPILVMAVMLFLILNATAVCILAERKVAAFTQDRYGPNRVGFWGLLQPIADGLKCLLKEDIIPANVDKPLFLLAPSLSVLVSLIGFAIIPWAGNVHWGWMPPGTTVPTQVASLDIGVLYVLAVGALSVYGIVLAGYASNNKYSFYGGMRAAAQLISYELPLGLALLCILLTTGSLRLEEIVAQQARSGIWYVFMQPMAFLLMLVSAFAETNRAPFDLPEAEQELVGGYHTEYSAMKFVMFFLAEYAHMITGSAVLICGAGPGWKARRGGRCC
jgi:NADH-quinone oxidoreductase subunit H